MFHYTAGIFIISVRIPNTDIINVYINKIIQTYISFLV